MLTRIATLTKHLKIGFFCPSYSFSDVASQAEKSINPDDVSKVGNLLPKFPVKKDIDFNSFAKQPKSEESTAFNKTDFHSKNIFKYAFRSLKKPLALDLIQEIELFAFSKKFDEVCCPTKLVCSKYSLFVLHYWLLTHRLSQTWSFSSWRIQKSLNGLLEDYIKDSVYSFQDHFDRDVYAELLRIKRTQLFSLDDYFVYNYKEKPLSQIVTEDILLGEYDEDSPMIEHLENYIQAHIEYLKTLSVSDLKSHHIHWGLQP